MTSAVAAAASGAPGAGMPSGTSVRRPKTTGSTVAGMSMFTVPTRVGVSSRRNRERRAEITSGSNDETSTRMASSPGPPWASAAVQMPMKATAGPVIRAYPAPMRPTRSACNIVQAPLTTTVANTAQARYASAPPAARITIVGMKTSPVMPSTTSCRPQLTARAAGGCSSGW